MDAIDLSDTDPDMPAGQVCEWYALCTRPALYRVFHPVLGSVPICRDCRARNARLAGVEVTG